MKKTSLYLEPELDAALARRAATRKVSKAQLIRDVLSASVAGDGPPPRPSVGAFSSGRSDTAGDVDKALGELGFGEWR